MKTITIATAGIGLLTLSGCGTLETFSNGQMGAQSGYYIPVTPFNAKPGYGDNNGLMAEANCKFMSDQYRALSADGNFSYSGASGLFSGRRFTRTVDNIQYTAIAAGNLELPTERGDKSVVRVSLVYGSGVRGTYVYDKGVLNFLYLVGGMNFALESGKTQVSTMGLAGKSVAAFTGLDKLEPEQFKESSNRLIGVIGFDSTSQSVKPMGIGFIFYGYIPETWRDDNKLVGEVFKRLIRCDIGNNWESMENANQLMDVTGLFVERNTNYFPADKESPVVGEVLYKLKSDGKTYEPFVLYK